MPRVPLRNEPTLLDAERARRLAEDARALLHAKHEDFCDDWVRMRLIARSAFDATLVALEVATDTSDPHVLAAALELAHERIRCDRDPFDYEIATIAESLLPHCTEISNRVRECARSKSEYLRCACARALGPRALRSLRGEGDDADAEAAAIVFALTKDKDADVRAAARDALEGMAPPAWAAFFERDPLASRTAAEAAKLRLPLDRAAKALEDRIDRDVSPLAAPLAELPDELAAPILDAWVKIPFATEAEGAEPLLERWITLDADGAKIAAFLDRGDAMLYSTEGARIGAVLARRPSEQAVAVCLRLAAILPRLERRETLALEMAEELIRLAWPDDADPRPLLEAALASSLEDAAQNDDGGSEDAELVFGKLIEHAIAPRPSFRHIVEALVDAFVAGFPGRWGRARIEIESRLLDVVHPRLRAHAEACLRSGDALAWALKYLTRGGHDSEHDPTPDAILREAVRDPTLRAALLRDSELAESAEQHLRALLAGGELDAAGTLVFAHNLVRYDDESSLRPEEWAAVRRARAQLEERDELSFALDVLPPIPSADDLEFLERLVDLHGHDPAFAFHVVHALEKRAAPELVPLLERLGERAGTSMQGRVREAIEVCRGERESIWRRS